MYDDDLQPNHDIQTAIMSRIPFKSLVKLRSLSKSWRDTIDSSYLRQLHIQNQLSNDIDGDGGGDDDTVLLRFDLWSGMMSILPLDTSKSYPCDDFPSYQEFLKNNVRDPGLCGPVHGLVCLYDLWLPNPIALYNPSLGEIKILPPCPPLPHSPALFKSSSNPRVVGLGYDDDVKKDFKVVQLAFDESLQITYVDLYSRKENTWGETVVHRGNLIVGEQMQHLLPSRGDCAVAHWSECKWGVKRDYAIVSFDMRKEEFKKIKSPYLGANGAVIESFAMEDSFIMFVSSDPERMATQGMVIFKYEWEKWIKVGRLGPFDGELVWPVAPWRSYGLVVKIESRDKKSCKLGVYDCWAQQIIKCFHLPLTDEDTSLYYRGSFISP